MFSKELIAKLKSRLTRSNTLIAVGLLVPIAVSMTACSSSVDLSQKEQNLSSRSATNAPDEVIWPDSPPSIADGKVYWEKNNCAQCHGGDGRGVPGKCDVDLTNSEKMRARKPLEEYRLIAFGEATFVETPTTSAIMAGANPEGDAAKNRLVKHEPFGNTLQKRQLWDLVFYARSLAVPLLTSENRMAMKAVFGANCAVCHGTRGAGDGPLNKGLVLQPNPANFNQFDRFYDRTDEQLWDHIANGIKWEGMPNFLGKQDKGNKVHFDAEYIWKLVQYVRNFHEDSDYALEGPKKASVEDSNARKMSQKPGSNSVH